MIHGAVNLLKEDLRELSIILESFVPHLDKIGIQLSQTTSLIKEIITGTEIFRRLKGISQVELLPFAFKQVPWFTRYTHSCLTYVFGEHVVNKLELNTDKTALEALKLCFLIHDLGHGPFSHLTERAFKRPRGRGGKIPKEYDHEYWTKVLLHELKDQLFDTNTNPYLNKTISKEEKTKLEIFSKAL
jgi:HD superfamily phosphohydrolase